VRFVHERIRQRDLTRVPLVLATLYAAKKYAVSGLAHSCILFLQYNLSADNACQLLEQALFFDEAEFAGRCRRLILDSGSTAIASEGFTSLPGPIAVEIIRDNELRVGEIDVFRACLRWADAECRRRELAITGSSRRQAMASLLPHVRLPLLPAASMPEVAASGVFGSDEIALVAAALSGDSSAASAALRTMYSAESRRSSMVQKMNFLFVDPFLICCCCCWCR
jgi:hypothetical protein